MNNLILLSIYILLLFLIRNKTIENMETETNTEDDLLTQRIRIPRSVIQGDTSSNYTVPDIDVPPNLVNPENRFDPSNPNSGSSNNPIVIPESYINPESSNTTQNSNSNSSSSSSSGSNQASGSSNTKKESDAGGILIAMAVIVIGAGGFFLWKKRKARLAQ